MADLVDGDELVAQMVWTLGTHRAYVVRTYLVAITSGTHITVTEAITEVAGIPYRELVRWSASQSYPEGVWGHRQRPTQSTTEGPVGTNPTVTRPTQGPLPCMVRGLIRLHTTDDPPRRPGLTFAPYPVLTFSDANGRPTATYQAVLNLMGNRLIEVLPVSGNDGTADLIPCVRYRVEGVTIPITSRSAGDKFATQRRRTSGTSPTPLPYGTGPAGV